MLISGVIFPFFMDGQNTGVVTPVQELVLGAFAETSPNPLVNISSNAKSAPQNLAIKSGTVNEVPSTFYLTVPKLGVEQATIETNSLSLSPDTSLGHYRGTSLPGEVGTSFIYGHSTLPWFFSATNYKTIFATLPTVSTGDTFYVHFNNLTYRYEVVATKILDPEEVDPLKDYGAEVGSSSTAVLMTCYPPGLSSKRFLAIGRLVF